MLYHWILLNFELCYSFSVSYQQHSTTALQANPHVHYCVSACVLVFLLLPKIKDQTPPQFNQVALNTFFHLDPQVKSKFTRLSISLQSYPTTYFSIGWWLAPKCSQLELGWNKRSKWGVCIFWIDDASVVVKWDTSSFLPKLKACLCPFLWNINALSQ